MELRKTIVAIFLLINSISTYSQQLLSQDALEAAKKNNFNPAIAELTTLLQKNDKNEATLIQRANAYILIGQFNEAVADAEKAVSNNTKSADATFLAATACISLTKNEQAIRYLNTTLELRPDWLQALQFRSKLYASMKYADLDNVIVANPNAPEVYLYRGRMYVRKMKYGYGVIDFGKVIELAYEGSKLKEIAKQEFNAAETEYNTWKKVGGNLYR